MISTYPMLPWYRDALLKKGVRIVTAAQQEVITLDEARSHLRLDVYEDGGSPASHPDDLLIQNIYLPAAREYCESLCGRAFVLQEFELSMREFPCSTMSVDEIELFPGPLRRQVSVTYLDGNGVTQTLDPATYYVDDICEPNGLYPITMWPSGLLQAPNAVKIRFWAGYGDMPGSPNDTLTLPVKYKHAVLLMLHHFYENRSDTEIPGNVPTAIEFGVKALITPSALRKGMA